MDLVLQQWLFTNTVQTIWLVQMTADISLTWVWLKKLGITWCRILWFWFHTRAIKKMISFGLFFRKFIDMGFIDKERIAIWGWVSSVQFVLISSPCHLYVFKKYILMTIFDELWPSVLRWLCFLHGFGSGNWTLQMWNCCCTGSKMGILWWVNRIYRDTRGQMVSVLGL